MRSARLHGSAQGGKASDHLPAPLPHGPQRPRERMVHDGRRTVWTGGALPSSSRPRNPPPRAPAMFRTWPPKMGASLVRWTK